MTTPRIELLWWDGCPSTEKAVSELREVLAEAGLAATEIEMREIKSDQEAIGVAFPGSPTVLIDGVDVAGADSDEALGLTCRVYRRRDGRVSPTPDPEDIREALRRAASDSEVNR